jgi:hypothetical protein
LGPIASNNHGNSASNSVKGKLANFTFSLHAQTADTATVREAMQTRRPHKHTAVVRHELGQRAGIPYEVEKTICSACARVLDERPIRRAAA